MKEINQLKWANYLLLYGIPTVLNYIACKLAIPYLESNSALPIEINYFICVGGITLVPMFFGSIYLTKKEINSSKWVDLLNRMRIYKLSRKDWIWTVFTFIFLTFSSFIIAKVVMPKLGFDATPFFFRNMPLDESHMWILYVWPIFLFFNIFGEEFFWRGYIQPRQELQLKKWTWLIHGILWAIWHIPMGFDLIFASLPIFFILPAVVQFRQNTTIAIVVHAVFGAFGFLAIAFGGIH